MISNRPRLRHIAPRAGATAARPAKGPRIIGTPGEGLRPSTRPKKGLSDRCGPSTFRGRAGVRAGLAGLARLVLAVAGPLGLAGLAGCVGAGPVAQTEAVAAEATTAEWTADWDDVPAAVTAALSRADAASEGMRVYRRPVAAIAPEAGAASAAASAGGESPERADLLAWEGPEVAVEFDLLLLTGETGVLRVERLAPPADDLGASTLRPAEPLRATVRLGAFGRPEREAEVLRLIAWRLEQLRGRDAAPFSWPG